MRFLKYVLMGFILTSSAVFTAYAQEVPVMAQLQQLQVNINTANVEQLASLPGIGEKKAQTIIKYRELNGDFTSLEQLTDVKGIGPKLLLKLKGKIVLQ
jgi:competence protein ComEA